MIPIASSVVITFLTAVIAWLVNELRNQGRITLLKNKENTITAELKLKQSVIERNREHFIESTKKIKEECSKGELQAMCALDEEKKESAKLKESYKQLKEFCNAQQIALTESIKEIESLRKREKELLVLLENGHE